MSIRRILIQPSGYRHINAGDLAMLQVCFQRLRAHLPHAEIFVVTADPIGLAKFCPGASPVPYGGEEALLGGSLLPDRVKAKLSARCREVARKAQRQMALRHHRLYYGLGRLKQLLAGHPAGDSLLRHTLEQCDALVVSGMGGFTETFESHALYMLALMQIAIRLGLKVAAFGQGLGPVRVGSRLWREASKTFPHCARICLREGVFGVDLLKNWGVDLAKVAVTGDDALEFVTDAMPTAGPKGRAGVNLRLAAHSGLGAEDAARIGKQVEEALKLAGLGAVAIPIAAYDGAKDEEVVEKALGLAKTEELGDIVEPAAVIRRLAEVDVVITCSYHAAIFALGQGIPVIGLAANDYYSYKFHGLRGQFPAGCVVLKPLDPHFGYDLRKALDHLLAIGNSLGDWLRVCAMRQVLLSRQEYTRTIEVLQKGV